MKALINGQVVDLQFDRATNRYYQTFTADSTTKQVSVISDCEGDTLLKDIQLEVGANATPYVVPEVQTGIISGIFKNLKQINLEMTDQENSSLWSNIKISTQGTLERYHRDHISTEITRTAEGIMSLVTGDGEGSVNSRMTQLRDLIEQRVSKEGLSAVIRNSGDNIMLAIANKGEGLKTAINLDKSAVRIKGETIHLDGAVFTEAFTSAVARIIKLSADSITTGQLDASKARIINLDANSITGLDANFIKAKIELAIVDWLKGKIIMAQNSAMGINLNQGAINFYTNYPAIRRSVYGMPNQFIKFATGEESNDNGFRKLSTGPQNFLMASTTSIGSNRFNDESVSDGGFTGINIHASGTATGDNIVDRIGIHSDILIVNHNVTGGEKGWVFENHNGKNNNYAIRPMHSNHEIYKAWIGTTDFPVDNIFTMDVTIKGHRLQAMLKDLANRIGHSGWADDLN